MASDSRVSAQPDDPHPDETPQAGSGRTSAGTPEPKATEPTQAAEKPADAAPAAPVAKKPQAKPATPAKPSTPRGKSAGWPAATKTGATQAKPPVAAATQAQTPPAASAAVTPAAADEGAGRAGDRRTSRFLLFAAVPSWLISMLVHVALLMILAFITIPEQGPLQQIVAVSNPVEEAEQLDNLDEEQIEPVDIQEFNFDAPVDITNVEPEENELSVPEFTDMDAAPRPFMLEDFAEQTAPSTDLTDTIGAFGGTGLEGRGAEGRKAMVAKYGGSKGSEAAVANALEWFAAHQMADGGWDFDHTKGPCKGRCSHPGIGPDARNAATAMALLPFLGAGQTHQQGKYKTNVEAGLAYLVKHMKVRRDMGELTEPGGNMYSHGLASIALCEAYAMTNDPGLLKPAQLALNYIVYAQDPVGGGWRYQPHQPGDTSVVGWQVMALKSGHLAYLKVPRETVIGATRFLDFVQEENGAKYGYTVPAARPSTTAVGLLCRMYLGWKKDEPGLKAGAAYLHALGPSENMYYNYYATQVMRQYGEQFWEDWNSQMRDRLVNSQDTKGHAKGSWYFADDPHGERGGRHYCTSMATMILEVYYRYMPLYGKEAAEEDFPL